MLKSTLLAYCIAEWDCYLEAIAKTAINNCPQTPPHPAVTNAINYAVFGPGALPSTFINSIEAAVLTWSEIRSEVWPVTNIFNGNPALRNFSNLIRSTTTAVGCASTVCINKVSSACVFSQPSLVARGRARNGEYANENAPPASRMDLLEYDCTAEQYALNHVSSCDRHQSAAASRPGYEENIHILETTATDFLGALQNAVATWSNELAANGIPSNEIYTLQVSQRTEKTVTRVTKVGYQLIVEQSEEFCDEICRRNKDGKEQ
uniref:SCP domain-containing protein n=1 Tax=Angiostrongylus cantonensis TaxID=6313 RepID=A0A0K0D3Q0_ANGCA